MLDNIWNNESLIKTLQKGGIVVMPTDTLYGIVGKAENKETVEHIYELRKRSPDKPCIILIANVSELDQFGIIPTEEQKKEIENYKESTSFVVDCSEEKFEYLHRGTKTLAFRIPAPKELQNLLKQTGSLIAPSANIEGEPPAKNILEAQKYFGNTVDLYIDGGETTGKASKVIKLHKDGSIDILRN